MTQSRAMRHYETWLLHVWHDSHLTWPIHPGRDSFTCDSTHSLATWLIHLCAMTHSQDISHPHVTHSLTRDMTPSRVAWPIFVWHDSFTCVTWLIHMCYVVGRGYRDMPHDSLICVTWVMTHSYVLCGREGVYDVWHDSFNCVDLLMTHEYTLCGREGV